MRTLRLKVKPNSRQEKLEQLPDGSWVAHVKAPPVDGKANEALIALVARHFDLRKSQVTLKSGAGSRTKWLHLAEPGKVP
jgi:uncharacterized protein